MIERLEKGPASCFPSIEKTYGRPIAGWHAVIRAQGDQCHMDLVRFLKKTHGMGHGHANALLAHTLAEDRGPCDGRNVAQVSRNYPLVRSSVEVAKKGALELRAHSQSTGRGVSSTV